MRNCYISSTMREGPSQKPGVEGDRRIVLIHGNGSGRLRHELEQMLRKDAGLRYFDASYQLFGQGALEVEILHRSK